MIKKLLLLSLLVSSLSIFAAAGEMAEAKPMKKGDAEKGSKLVGTCVACHGVDGNSVVGQWPTLAGQRESYLFEQLEHIRDEERVIAVMKGLLNNYSDLNANWLITGVGFMKKNQNIKESINNKKIDKIVVFFDDNSFDELKR